MGGKVTQTIKEKLGIIQTCTYLTITAKGDDSYGNVTHSINLKNIVEIWAENFQCFALDIQGNLYAWGLNDNCQLGNGKSDNYIFPKDDPEFSFVNNLRIINLSKGLISDKIFKDQNPLYLKYIKKISCGDGFTVCLDREGTVFTWGKSNKGQLGYELKYEESTIIFGTKCQATPRIVESLSERNIVISDIICGSDFTFAVNKDGHPFSWGNNNHSQLARSTKRTMETIPEHADLLSPFEKIQKICLGWMHGSILTDTGEVYFWGNPFFDYDKAFEDFVEPTKIELPFKAVDLANGFHHFCAILDEYNKFELYTWGANEYGQCGIQVKQENKLVLFPTKISFKKISIMNVSSGAFHTICHMTEDKLYGFGHNYSKELGDYSAVVIDRPVIWGWNIKENDKYKIKKVICGNGYSIVVQVPIESKTFYESEHIDYKNVSIVTDTNEAESKKAIELMTVANQNDEKNNL